MMGAFKPNVYRWEVLFFSCSQQEQNKQLHLTIFMLDISRDSRAGKYYILCLLDFWLYLNMWYFTLHRRLSEEQDVLQSMSNSIFKSMVKLHFRATGRHRRHIKCIHLL